MLNNTFNRTPGADVARHRKLLAGLLSFCLYNTRVKPRACARTYDEHAMNEASVNCYLVEKHEIEVMFVGVSEKPLLPSLRGPRSQWCFEYADHASESANIINVARRLLVTKQCDRLPASCFVGLRLIRPATLTTHQPICETAYKFMYTFLDKPVHTQRHRHTRTHISHSGNIIDLWRCGRKET